MTHACRRARYLRLPTSGPRSTAPPARPIAQKSGSTRFPLSQRSIKTEGSVDDTSKADPHPPTPFPTPSGPLGVRSGIAMLLSNKPRSSTSATRPRYPSSPSREPSPTRTQSSIAPGRETSLVGLRLPARSRSRGSKEPSPARSRMSSARAKDEGKPRRSPTSSAGGDLNRTKLWLELREVQRKSRPPTERSS